MDTLIESTEMVSIPEWSPVRRVPPRAEMDRQDNYLEHFDFTTLIADAFVDQDNLWIVGPALLNLHPHIRNSVIYVDGQKVTSPVEISDFDRVYRGRIEVHGGHARELLIRFPDGHVAEIALARRKSEILKGQRVLATVQKDNNTEWILYWVLFNRIINGITSVLIYDNGSSSYSVDELAKALKVLPGLDQVVIVDWKCPWGPTGGPNQKWDSDFGQHVALEHMRLKYLSEASSVLWCDIDELLVSKAGSKVMVQFEESETPVVRFPRQQVVQVLRPGFHEGDTRVHRNYGYVKADGSLLNSKYICRPSLVPLEAQFKAHHIDAVADKLVAADEMVAGHYGGIRMDWRNFSFDPVKNSTEWPVAVELNESFLKAFELVEDEWRSVEEMP